MNASSQPLALTTGVAAAITNGWISVSNDDGEIRGDAVTVSIGVPSTRNARGIQPRRHLLSRIFDHNALCSGQLISAAGDDTVKTVRCPGTSARIGGARMDIPVFASFSQ